MLSNILWRAIDSVEEPSSNEENNTFGITHLKELSLKHKPSCRQEAILFLQRSITQRMFCFLGAKCFWTQIQSPEI